MNGEENSSPGKDKVPFNVPFSPSKIQIFPSVEHTATRDRTPHEEPANTNGVEKTFPVIFFIIIVNNHKKTHSANQKKKYQPTTTKVPHFEIAAEDSSRSPRTRSQTTSPLARSRACIRCECEPMNTVVRSGSTSSTGEASTHLPVSELHSTCRPIGRTSDVYSLKRCS
ncbi:hypothetical protein DNTS_023968 [Danionella cerebrum]|uniref:Uncharacterized protein n=1 Tax=Danionella cerebrum TaxID=2873325 RepID=A0A553MV62_9TELE|nr:hypothetical protein DNTS_023968 [Danionella translucida]